MIERHRNIPLLLLLGAFLVLTVSSIRHKAFTYDEPLHYLYGLNLWNMDTAKFADGVMPVSFLNVIPHRLKMLLAPDPRAEFDLIDSIIGGRYVTILCALLLGLYVFKWSREMYGATAAVFSLLLYTFSPNIIAHARLVTLDLYAACGVTISLYYFRRFVNSGGWKRGVLSALTLGAAQLAKATALHLYLIYPLILLIRRAVTAFHGKKTQSKGVAPVPDLKYFLKYSLLFAALSILIINAGFLFNRSFRPLKAYQFKSTAFQSLQKKLKPLGSLPVPLPEPYVAGLDLYKYNLRHGKYIGNLYLLGKIQRAGTEEMKGFIGYYLIAALFKMPLATLLILAVALIYYLLNFKKFRFAENEAFLLIPVLIYAIYFNFFFKLNIGIRHFLVVLPLLHIFCGAFFQYWQCFSHRTKSFLAVLMVYLVVSVTAYFPHYISYFNELIWDKKQACKILADSNLDWGQNRGYLKSYLKENPAAVFEPPHPVRGRVVVGVNKLVGVQGGPEIYAWLREHHKPVAHIAYSYLVYDVNPSTGNDLHR